ncbi:unnamed protein product [Hymenolepis diminuta]|uniref:Uncharacterized protein n=1 Tax=Hymenolepis diminuta TaxID=6216 RepID=A0A564Z7T1_HYMDI|nr:unnamed protein product [Hymenolepis diminuta]VUZ55053.1 unnamed protein product [Hymenolepis diminuta]
MIRQGVSIIKDISASLSSPSTPASANYLNGIRTEISNEYYNVHSSPDLEKCPVVPQGHIFRLDNFLSCKLPNTIEANLSPSCGQNTKRRDSNVSGISLFSYPKRTNNA